MKRDEKKLRALDALALIGPQILKAQKKNIKMPALSPYLREIKPRLENSVFARRQ